LFYSGIILKPNKINILKQLSKELDPFAGKIEIRLMGSTDDIPIPLGYSFENSRIPREDLIIGSISESNAVFPNNNTENRLKNRSIIIRITQKKYD